MLETGDERVILLKAGFRGKEIEKLYISKNGFKVVENNTLQEEICSQAR